MQSCRAAGEFAFDIETDPHIITCISLAYRDDEALSIPMHGHSYWSMPDMLEVYKALKALLEDNSLIKIGQNVSYDIIGLAACGISVAPPYYDTMHMHHALDSNSLHNLALQASLYTNHPFWKDWEQAPPNTGVGNLYEYNAKDSVVTKKLKNYYFQFHPEILPLYESYYKVQPHLLAMNREGVCVDHPMQFNLAAKLRNEVRDACVNVARNYSLKDFNVSSSLQVQDLLYTRLRLPKQFHWVKRQRKLTVDEDALLAIYVETQDPLPLLLRQLKQKRKLITFLDPASKDAKRHRSSWDGRLRCEYKQTTTTGRLSSSASQATNIGINLQNIPHEVRSTIIAAPGHIFLEADYKQAQARIVVWDSLDTKYMQLFEQDRLTPGSFDFHWFNAELTMEKERSYLNKADRDTCKHIVYGSFFDMRGRKLQATVLKHTEPLPLFLPLDECERRQQNFRNAVPSFTERQMRIREEVLRTGQHISPTGRIVTYHEVIIDDDLKYCFGRRDYSETFRSAYSMIPQDVECYLTKLAIVELDTTMRARAIGRVALQVHDSLVLEVLDNEQSVADAYALARTAMEREFIIRAEKMIIPVDFKIGYHWAGEVSGLRSEATLLAAYRSIKR
jgi:DNA polymerase-1